MFFKKLYKRFSRLKTDWDAGIFLGIPVLSSYFALKSSIKPQIDLGFWVGIYDHAFFEVVSC